MLGAAMHKVMGSHSPLLNSCVNLQILKDIINKYQLLQGRRVRYIPGWDCHGLPIELKVGLPLHYIVPHDNVLLTSVLCPVC